MQQEQAEEERHLSEKEHQFCLVDRLGLVILMQKFCSNKAQRSDKDNQAELEVLKRYFANREHLKYEKTEHDDILVRTFSTRPEHG